MHPSTKLPIDLSLYLVTHRGNRSFEDFFRIILEAIEGGVTIVQLREKRTPLYEMIEIAKNLHALLKPLGIPLIINDRIDVAHAVGAEGVHLGQSDFSVKKARALLGKEAIIGISVETIEQAIAAADEEIDYLAASPLFATQTKSDCASPWGLDGLQKLCAISPYPVIAIGGINEANIQSVFASGAVGAAVISSIFNASCPKTAALKMRKK